MVRLTCAPAASGPTETHSRMQNRKSLPNQALQRTIGSLARSLAAERQNVSRTRAMHGVPDTVPLKPFVGLEFNQIALGRYQTQFHCAGAGSIHLEGRWEFREADGTLVDASMEHEKRDAWRR
jgi:hypothetical protein